MNTSKKAKSALISVFHKDGLEPIAKSSNRKNEQFINIKIGSRLGFHIKIINQTSNNLLW